MEKRIGLESSLEQLKPYAKWLMYIFDVQNSYR